MYKIIIGIIVLLVAILLTYNYFYSSEHFELIVANDDQKNLIVKKVDLQHFFQFIEYFQTADMNQEAKFGEASCHIKGESVKIANDIRNILSMLHFIVNANGKDNFYQRYLVMKVGANLDYDRQNPYRRQNYDELVRGHIGKQFTFLPENEYDKYYPRPSIDTEYQYPLPNSINVHNYYTEENIEINLKGLLMLLELVQTNDINAFHGVYSPTEEPVFNNELFIPLKSIKNSILRIVNTPAYREYVLTIKFADKYK